MLLYIYNNNIFLLQDPDMDVKEEAKHELNGNLRYLFISFYIHICSNFEWKKNSENSSPMTNKVWILVPN